MKRNSLYAHLLLCFFVLMIPMQLSGAVLIWLYNNTIKKSITEVLSSDLRQLMRSFSDTINNLNGQLHVLLYERDLVLRGFPTTSAGMSTNEYWMELNNIRSRMEFITLSNNIIDDIQLVYPTLGICLSVRLGLSQITNTNDYIIRNLPLTLAYDEDRDALCVGRMYPSLSYTAANTVPSSILQATLSGNTIRQMLSSSAYPEYPAVLIYKKAGKVYCNTAGEEWDDMLLNLPSTQKSVMFKGRSYSVFVETDETLGYTVMRLLPDDVFFRTTRLYMWLLILYCLLTVPLMFFYGKLINKIVMKPVNILKDAFHKIENEEFNFALKIDTPAVEFQMLIYGFNSMLQRLDDLIHRVYRQEVYTHQIELKQLQAQINPHFLYNTFFIFRHMLKNEELTPAMSLANYLGEYFHYITRTAQTEVPLADEYRHAVNYIHIQRMRYAKRLDARIANFPDDTQYILVPRLILQPLLENVFNYAMNEEGETLILRLSFDININRRNLHIIVEDNGKSLSDDQINILSNNLNTDQSINETTGMINIHRRLKLNFGLEFGLALSRSDLGGLRIYIKIPFPDDRKETE